MILATGGAVMAPAALLTLAQRLRRRLGRGSSSACARAKRDVPAALPLIGYGAVALIVLVFVGVLGWALTRLARGFADDPTPR